MNKVLYFFYLPVLLLSFSCRNSSTKTGDIKFAGADPAAIVKTVLSAEEIAEISRTIASPVEIANLLLSRDIPFSQSNISPFINPDNQITEFDKALALGFLGADLGYLNIYEKTSTSSGILQSIGSLSEGLGAAHLFDQETIKRLTDERSNLDSLLFLSIDSYSRIDKFFKDDNRDHLSALMIIGVWIEGQYLATRVVKQSPDKILKDRIGEQKLILNDLTMLASQYCARDQKFMNLCKYLQEISERYKDVKITYSTAKQDSLIQNGAPVITQAEKSEVEMTDQQLEGIILVTERIRNKLISNN